MTGGVGRRCDVVSVRIASIAGKPRPDSGSAARRTRSAIAVVIPTSWPKYSARPPRRPRRGRRRRAEVPSGLDDDRVRIFFADDASDIARDTAFQPGLDAGRWRLPLGSASRVWARRSGSVMSIDDDAGADGCVVVAAAHRRSPESHRALVVAAALARNADPPARARSRLEDRPADALATGARPWHRPISGAPRPARGRGRRSSSRALVAAYDGARAVDDGNRAATAADRVDEREVRGAVCAPEARARPDTAGLPPRGRTRRDSSPRSRGARPGTTARARRRPGAACLRELLDARPTRTV